MNPKMNHLLIFAVSIIIFLAVFSKETSAQSEDNTLRYKPVDHYNRYILTTNAIPGQSRQLMFTNSYLAVYNSLSYGLTDHISVSTHVSPILGAIPDVPLPVSFGTEVKLPSINGLFHFSAGAQYATLLGDPTQVGLFFAKSTFGNTRNNLTLSLRYATGRWSGKATEFWNSFTFSSFTGNKISPDFSYLNAGLMAQIQLTDRFMFITENNTMCHNAEQWISFTTFRYIGTTYSMDFGLISTIKLDQSEFDSLLYLGVNVPFNF